MVYSLEIIKKAKDKVSRFDAENILARLLGVTRMELYTYEGKINEDIIAEFNSSAEKRASGMPLEYILGTAQFMGLELMVTQDVLIPRPETELLVEKTIEITQSINYKLSTINLLDLGTGSGNIAIALTRFITDCKIISSDVSARALCIARENARLNLVDKKLDFILSSLFTELPKIKFDIIVSNPPYVASSQIEGLSKEISFEPRIALDGGADGLDFYRNIINTSHEFLREKGFLILEIGFGQSNEVKKLLHASNFKKIRLIKDYNNINRIAVAQWIS